MGPFAYQRALIPKDGSSMPALRGEGPMLRSYRRSIIPGLLLVLLWGSNIFAQPGVVQIIETSKWSPPSPDPSGIAYKSKSHRLIVSDGEVNEMEIYQGVNVWEVSLTGKQKDEFSTLDFSDEPTGIASYNAKNGHLYITDDTSPRGIYELDSGSDGKLFTSDDIVTLLRFSDLNVNNADLEGVALNPQNGHLFVVDGRGSVFELDAGLGYVNDFDVTSYFGSPEGIEYNPDKGTLYLVGSASGDDFIIEITTSGEFVSQINISFIRNPAGLAYAPSSRKGSERSLYIVDRGVDNGFNPKENDGRIYEISLGRVSHKETIGGHSELGTPEFLPETISLSPNYPNPFNLETRIQYSLPEEAQVKLLVFNLNGQLVRELVNGIQSPGYKSVVWNGLDILGREVGSGVYFVQLIAANQSFVRKVSLLK